MSRGDFGESCLPFHNELAAFALKLTRDKDVALDLVQDTYAKACKAWPSFQAATDHSEKAWMYRILQNTFNNHYSINLRRSKRLDSNETYIKDSLHQGGQTEMFQSDGFGDEVLEALNVIPADYREMITQVVIYGKQTVDVAKEFRMPIGTVLSRLARGRKLLRMTLAKYARQEYGLVSEDEVSDEIEIDNVIDMREAV